MPTQWVASATGLPHEDETIEFILHGRQIAMGGTYARQVFRSRWSGYEVQRVRTWRPVGVDRGGGGEAEELNP